VKVRLVAAPAGQRDITARLAPTILSDN